MSPELRWGQAPELTQEGGTVRISNGSWFDQSGSDRAEGYLYRLGSNTHGVILHGTPMVPPKTVGTDASGACTLPGFSREGNLVLPLYPAWIGAELQAEVYGGNLTQYPEGWVWEFGRHQAHDSAVWPNRSNTLIVKDWRAQEPPHTTPPTSRQVRDQVIPILKAWEATQSGPIDVTRIRLARRILELPDRGLMVKLGAVREVLDARDE